MIRFPGFIFFVMFFMTSCSTRTKVDMMQQTFESYRNALNNHDVEKSLSFLAEDFKLVFVDFDMTMTKEQVVDVLGWDAGANTKVTHGELQVFENTIASIFSEQNDFLKLIDILELKAKIAYEFGEDGLIKQQLYEALPNQPSFEKRMGPAVEWAMEHRKEELAIIYPNNQMVFNEEMARRWVALLQEWRTATNRKNYP